MNYQTFSRPLFRPRHKKLLQSNHLHLRDTSGEYIPFASVSMTRFVLMFTKNSNIRFLRRRRYKLIAQRHRENPFWRGIRQQHGKDSVDLHKFLVEPQILVRVSFVMPAKHVAANFSEFAAPENVEVVSGRKIESSSKKCVEANSRQRVGFWYQQKNCKLNHPSKICKGNLSATEGRFYKYFSLIESDKSRNQPVVVTSGNLRGKVPVVDYVFWSQEQPIYSTSSFFENCVKF